MYTHNETAMINHCDKLATGGAKLSVYWNGGNDSGYFELRLNDGPIKEIGELEQQILDLVEEHLGYGSFAGDFSTDGEIRYDPETKCFEGTDDYSETEGDERCCAIEVTVPRDIWFDRLLLRVTSYSDTGSETVAELIVRNGSVPEQCETVQKTIEDLLLGQFDQETVGIEDFAGMWETFDIPRKDFGEKDGKLLYLIETFRFHRNQYESKDIYIPLQS